MRRVYGHISSVVGNCVDRKKVLGERERGAGSVESCFPKSLLLPPSPPKTDLFPERGCIRLLSLSLSKVESFPSRARDASSKTAHTFESCQTSWSCWGWSHQGVAAF